MPLSEQQPQGPHPQVRVSRGNVMSEGIAVLKAPAGESENQKLSAPIVYMDFL